MDSPLQLFAWVILAGLAVVVGQFIVNQFRLFRFARQSAELEHEHLRERISQLAQRRRETRDQAEASWSGFRKFRIVDKVLEARDVCSFYLSPHDGKPLPVFRPGQYLTFQLRLPGQTRPVVRCYSLSDRPGILEQYRVTIKRVPPPPNQPDAPPGLVSNYFHDQLGVGDIVDVKAPAGQFVLDLDQPSPVVLIAGGVGLTPLLSMVNALAETRSTREVWFFYGVRQGREHIMKEHLRALTDRLPTLRLHVCYSDPSEEDRAATPPAFQHTGRVSIDLLKRLLPSNQFDFYICGPPPMMNALVDGLRAWQVPAERIHFEAFGSATVKKPALQSPGSTTTQALKIQFSRSGKVCAWREDVGSVLELAEKNGVAIDSGCRAGNCGTCLVAVKSGEVTYLHEPGAQVEAGSCLACIAVPKTALVLDA